MMLNDIIFMVMWWLFFREFQQVGSWGTKEMTALLAFGFASYGIMSVFFGGSKDVAAIIVSGELDSYLTKPKNPLLHIIGSKSAAKGWGHLVMGILILLLSGLFSPFEILLALIGMITGGFVFSSMRIFYNSLTFWIGSSEVLSEKFLEALILFSVYPSNIYSGLTQLVMFTIIPAGVITFLPVELVRDFTLTKLLALLLASIAFVCLAFYTFFQGLKRYESGNQFATRR